MTARRRWIWIEGKGLVEVSADYKPQPRVHIISDIRQPFQSMADGKMYDSWSKYRAEIKARGFEEVGNEKALPYSQTIPQDDPTIGDDLRQTFQEYGVSVDS